MTSITVIIPYYKKRKFIKKTIKSVLSQSFKRFEIIIIYDDNNKKDLPYIKN
jgi:teichuronic acid biosynthesis glycosyltransferase TuaG